jgi:hypothetical protein
MKDLGLVNVLEFFGFDPKVRAKLVRHQDKRYDVHDLIRRDWFEAYQSFQSRPVFDGLDFIVSFVGLSGTQARLVGIYRVLAPHESRVGRLPSGCPYVEWKQSARRYYQLERQDGFEAIENRLVVDWGAGTLAWHQRLTNKPVLQLLPKGQLRAVFADYLGFTLTHSELKELYRHADANSEWRARLSAFAGVYLVLATTTGHQYVGSAYGATGIWGRWAQYATNGHGGNVQLRRLLASNAAYPDAFTFSILQILPRTAARAEVLRWEQHYKRKLGSMASGLNSNL